MKQLLRKLLLSILIILTALFVVILFLLIPKNNNPQTSTNETTPLSTNNPDHSSFLILRAIIKQKIESYDNYNRLSIESEHPQLLYNIQRYYANYPIYNIPKNNNNFVAYYKELFNKIYWLYKKKITADNGQNHTYRQYLFSLKIHEFYMSYIRHLQEFTRWYLKKISDNTIRSNLKIVRAENVETINNELFPQEINDYEDIKFFPNLPTEEHTYIEAYDLDSFRDFGIQWELFQDVLNKYDDEFPLEIDPFATEIIAEGIAQYGVLVLRTAGEIAIKEPITHLIPSHLDRARQKIFKFASRNNTLPPRKVLDKVRVSSSKMTISISERYFDDVTNKSGLSFLHDTAKWSKEHNKLEQLKKNRIRLYFQGSGVAVGDVDNDNLDDILFLGGGGNSLYVNNGDNRFSLKHKTNLTLKRNELYAAEPRQGIIADFDNDGLQDIFITYVDDNHRIYKNHGNYNFKEVPGLGDILGGKGLSGGPATVFDYDQDGLIDIYIAYFGNWVYRQIPKIGRKNNNYTAPPNILFRNIGNMKFEMVNDIGDGEDRGWANAVSHTDLNGDLLQDIVIANDFGINSFLLNLGDGRFKNIVNDLEGNTFGHGMNVSFADLNNDLTPDVYITNIGVLLRDERYVLPKSETEMKFENDALNKIRVKEADMLYISVSDNGKLIKYERSEDITRGVTSTGWAWGSCFLDFDNDSDDDTYVVNGYIPWLNSDKSSPQKNIHKNKKHVTNVFFLNENGKLHNRSYQSGTNVIADSRSVAKLDYDNDGDIDLVINNYESQAIMLSNNSETLKNNWIKVKLIGDPEKKCNRDAIGARLIAKTSDGDQIWREIYGGSGFLSMDSKIQHFGLGKATSAIIEIQWPNGDKEVIRDLSLNELSIIEQGKWQPSLK